MAQNASRKAFCTGKTFYMVQNAQPLAQNAHPDAKCHPVVQNVPHGVLMARPCGSTNTFWRIPASQKRRLSAKKQK